MLVLSAYHLCSFGFWIVSRVQSVWLLCLWDWFISAGTNVYTAFTYTFCVSGRCTSACLHLSFSRIGKMIFQPTVAIQSLCNFTYVKGMWQKHHRLISGAVSLESGYFGGKTVLKQKHCLQRAPCLKQEGETPSRCKWAGDDLELAVVMCCLQT